MTVTEIILSITTAVFGGTNLIQLLLLRNTKAKAVAETETIQIKALQQVIATMQQEIERLNNRVLYLEDRLYKQNTNKPNSRISLITKNKKL